MEPTEEEDLDYEKIQHSLMNQYMANGKESVLRKILNFNPDKKKLKPINNKAKYHMPNYHPKLFASLKPQHSNFVPDDSNIKSDIRKFNFYDPMYKEKQMKGSSKWATQRLNVMKLNIAKRYSAPVDSIQFPRKEFSNTGNRQILNGNLLTEDNVSKFEDNSKSSYHLKPIKNKIRKVETKYKSDNALNKDYMSMPILSKQSCKF